MTPTLRELNRAVRPGERVYLVGGCVRDLLLGRATRDADVVTTGNPSRLAERLAQRLGGTPFLMHSETRTYRVVPRTATHGIPVDVQPLAGSIEADLERRDFAVNAMALELPFDRETASQRVVDPFGGMEDLHRRRVRHVRPDIFTSDPVRLLRAVRISAALAFDIAPETEALIREHAALLAQAAAERVRDELFLLLELPGAADAIQRLDSLQLLEPVVPEVAGLKGLPQNANHHLDAWEHTLETIRQCERVLSGEELPADVAVPVRRALARPACPPRSRAALLLFAALLHDIAKPQTRGMTANGVVTFWGHDEAGADTARAVCSRLRLSRREGLAVAAIVRAHLRPGFLAGEQPVPSLHCYRFFSGTGTAAPEALILSLADRLAARGPWATPEQIERHRAFVTEMLRLYLDKDPVAHPVLPVGGQELVRATGLRPGRRLGEVMEALREAVATGRVRTRAEAEELARRLVAVGSPADRTDPPASGHEATQDHHLPE